MRVRAPLYRVDTRNPVDWSHPLNAGRVMWLYGLPEQSGGETWRDITQQTAGGILSGSPSLDSTGRGDFGPAYNGSGQYFTLSKSVAGFPAITLAFWINPSSLSGPSTGFFSTDNSAASWYLWMPLSTGQVEWNLTGTGVDLIVVPGMSLGKWYRWVLTYDGATARIYRNGELVSSAMGSGTPDAGAGVPSQRFSTFYPVGTWSDVGFWSRGFSTADVRADYDLSQRHYPGVLRRVRPATWFVGAAGIAFDAASNSGYQAASSSYSWSHTCTGTNRYLAVDVSRLSVPGTIVTGITYNGVALSQVGATSTGTDAGKVDCWGLANPASGTNTIAVTLSGVCISAACAVSYAGVNQTVPTESYNGATATNVGAADATVTVTTVADNDWVHAALATDDPAVTAGQTTRNNITGAGGSVANEDTGPKTPAGSQAMTYTGVGALATWAIGGYAIRPVAASGLSAPQGWECSIPQGPQPTHMLVM